MTCRVIRDDHGCSTSFLQRKHHIVLALPGHILHRKLLALVHDLRPALVSGTMHPPSGAVLRNLPHCPQRIVPHVSELEVPREQ